MYYSRLIILSLILFGFYACDIKHKSEQDLNVKNLKEEYTGRNKEISNILEISKDTIIASLYYSWGIIISKNGGKTWEHLAKNYRIDGITMTDKGYLVGIDCYIGGSFIYVSKDFGITWGKMDFNKMDFQPIEIVSNPKEQLKIKIYTVVRLNKNQQK